MLIGSKLAQVDRLVDELALVEPVLIAALVDTRDLNRSWVDDQLFAVRTAKVGVAKRNWFGLRDIEGNVEREHQWMLEDLEALGESREKILARMPPPTVAAVVGAQYYWIYHHHPVALLGYIMVVESEPPSVQLVERTIGETGLPREGFRNFLRHAILEPAHNDALDRLLDSLPLSREQQGLIGVSVIQTSNLIARAAEEILEFHELAKAATGSLPTAVVRSGDRAEQHLGL